MSYWDKPRPDFSALVGKTLASVQGAVGDEEMTFACTDGSEYRLYHSQDCCESVNVEDIIGDVADIIGSPILKAEEATSSENPPDAKKETIEYQDSFTWSFYKIDTIKGGVTIRWYGSSNGYYGETADFVELTPATTS